MQTPTAALAQQSSGGSAPHELAMPVPALAIKARHHALGEIMSQVMQKGTDYDEIPGTNKPTLLKAGAETLMSCFSLHPDVETVETYDANIGADLEVFETVWSGPQGGRSKERIKKTIHKNGFYEVRARCTLRASNGAPLATMSGSCNSWEAKYVGQSLHDVKNTVLKMAEKRAVVAAVLVVTGASRVFTQDVEDMAHLTPETVKPAKSAKSDAPEAPPKRREPTPQEAFDHNKKRIDAAPTHEALKLLKLEGSKFMAEAQIAELREYKTRRLAELAAQEPAGPQAPEQAEAATEKPPAVAAVLSPEETKLHNRATELYSRLGKLNKDEARRIWDEAGGYQERVDQLHTALLGADNAYRSRHAQTDGAEQETSPPEPDWDNFRGDNQ